MGQPPMGRSWNDAGEISIVMASPMQKAKKRSDVRGRRRARGGGRRQRQPMLDGSEDVLRRQRLEILAGMMMAEPIQKAPRAQENAIAGLRLESTHPAQIVREGGSKAARPDHRRHLDTEVNESFGRHSPSVSEAQITAAIRGESVAERAQIAIDDDLALIGIGTAAHCSKMAEPRNTA